LKKCPIFLKVAKTVAKLINAKIQTIFLKSTFRLKFNKFVPRVVTHFWAISPPQKITMSLKSSLIGEKSPNLTTL
jgi:hypothetical protein